MRSVRPEMKHSLSYKPEVFGLVDLLDLADLLIIPPLYEEFIMKVMII